MAARSCTDRWRCRAEAGSCNAWIRRAPCSRCSSRAQPGRREVCRMITVTALKWAPDIVRGLVRDLRVRWALEEAGLPYREKLVDPDDQASVDYRAWQPFGQVPAFEEDGLSLFESGAIVLHVGARSPALMPSDDVGRARATTWVFAAINSIEPFFLQ